MPFNVGPVELLIVLVIALLVIGPRRLPEMGNAVGKTIREFRKASTDITDAATLETEAKPAASATSAAPAPAATSTQTVETPAAETPATATPAAATPAAATPATEAPPAEPAAADAPAETKSDDA